MHLIPCESGLILLEVQCVNVMYEEQTLLDMASQAQVIKKT